MVKPNFFILLIIFLVTGIGCKQTTNNISYFYSSWGIILNPPSTVTTQLAFDWNAPTKSTIVNINAFPATVIQIPDSSRIFIDYYFPFPLDSTQVNVNNLYTFLTKKLQSYSINNVTDTFGSNIFYEISNTTSYKNPFFEQNYLTIPFSFYYLYNSGITHRISLVYNSDNINNLWHTGYDTMYVELRHNANGDTINAQSILQDWVAFNLNGLRPKNAPDTFKIKMSYLTISQSTGTRALKTIVIPAKWK